MKVVTPAGSFTLGVTETTPTIGIVDYSRRVTDDFGVTTVVERGFARRMTVKFAVPFDDVDALQRRLADLRATPATWIADDRFASLAFEGFYKDFSIDLAVPPLSFCTLTVEGLAGGSVAGDLTSDPAPIGQASTLRLLQPALVETSALTSSSVPETDHATWSAATAYAVGARVIVPSMHRIYESLVAGNQNHDPVVDRSRWLDVGPTNRWAMFDQALGTATASAAPIAVTVVANAVNAVALLDVVATTARVQTGGYDRTVAVVGGTAMFLDLPASGAAVTVTASGPGAVSIGTLLVGTVTSLGITEASPTAGINDFSRKDVDDFGQVSVVERAWSKKMDVQALIRTDAIDLVADRIASVRARPSLWIGQPDVASLALYGFFRDFSIEAGESVSKLSLSIEGLSTAAPVATPLSDTIGAIKDAIESANDAIEQTQGAVEAIVADQTTQGEDIANLVQIYGDTASAAVSAAAAGGSATVAQDAAANSAQSAEEAAAALALANSAASGSAGSAAVSANARDAALAAQGLAIGARDAAQAAQALADQRAAAAAASASGAGGFATTASGQASIATTKAGEAGTSASNANASAITASTKAGEAIVSAANAATSETNALGSRTAAATSATVSATNADTSKKAVLAAVPQTFDPRWWMDDVVYGEDPRTKPDATFLTPLGNGYQLDGSKNSVSSKFIIPVITGDTYEVTLGYEPAPGTALLPPDRLSAVFANQRNAQGLYVGGQLGGYGDFTRGNRLSFMFTANPGVETINLLLSLDVSGSSSAYKTILKAIRVENVSAREKAKSEAAAAVMSASSAATSKDAAGQSAAAAQGSATTASTKAGEASTSASQASSSKDTAAGHASTASIQAGVSSTSRDQAVAAKDAAVTAQGLATGAATAAATSASTATTKAGEAGAAASAAAGSATTATTKAGEAATSASQASTSKDTAAGHASTASIQAGVSSTSRDQAIAAKDAAVVAKDGAVTAQGLAAGSATAAATSASTASTKAGEAGTSASAAQGSAATASTKAGEAVASAGQAATSESNASGSRTAAATSATLSASNADASKRAALAALPQTFDPRWWMNDVVYGADPRTYPDTTFLTPLSNGYRLSAPNQTISTKTLYPVTPGETYEVVVEYEPAPGAAQLPAGYSGAILGSQRNAEGIYIGGQPGFYCDMTRGTRQTFTFGVSAGTALINFMIFLDASGSIANLSTIFKSFRVENVTSREAAKSAAAAAVISASSAATSKSGADQSASAAAGSATTATTKAGEAASSASQASTSKDTAAGHASTASIQAGVSATSRDQAIAAKDAAVVAKDGAVSAQGLAAGSASAAATSASTASTKAGEAGTAASAANQSRLDAQAAAGTSTGQAAIATSAASTASSKAAEATASANLSAAVSTGYFNKNPVFSDPAWPAGNGNTPPGWGGWLNPGYVGPDFDRVGRFGARPLRMDRPAGGEAQGIQQSFALCPAAWYVFECEVELVSGTWDGSGAIWGLNIASGENSLPFGTTPDTAGVVARGATPARRTWSVMRLLPDPAAGYMYLVGRYGPFISVDGTAANRLAWHKAGMRPATAGEIAANRVIPLEARVTTAEGALATVQGRVEAYSVKEVVAGGAAAFISFRAKDDAGVLTSDVAIGARTISLFNQQGNQWVRAMYMAGGNAVFTGGLQAGAFIRLGTGEGWPVALKAKDYSVADGETVSFGTNLGGLPALAFAANNLAPLAAGETYRLYADSLTATGFIARLRISVPGTPSNYDLTAPTTPGTGPTFQMDKAALPDSTDGNYRLKFSGTTALTGSYTYDGSDPGGPNTLPTA